jgi:hypothetical protein
LHPQPIQAPSTMPSLHMISTIVVPVIHTLGSPSEALRKPFGSAPSAPLRRGACACKCLIRSVLVCGSKEMPIFSARARCAALPPSLVPGRTPCGCAGTHTRVLHTPRRPPRDLSVALDEAADGNSRVWIWQTSWERYSMARHTITPNPSHCRRSQSLAVTCKDGAGRARITERQDDP